ncbi:hypothetical protein ThvES_00004950 [Thiovulum sp. ES]|nr:hypothetical protein ThvES_00004950 [Thiovulum sp. ES]
MKYTIFLLSIFLFSCSGEEEKQEKSQVAVEDNISNEENETDDLIDQQLPEEDTDEIEEDENEGAIVVIPDDEDEQTENMITETKEKMTRGREYRVYTGDKVIETSNAIVKIIKRTDRDYTSVYLVGGSATVYRSAE